MSAKSQPLVVLTAGGTGGHMFPAEALAAELGGRGLRLALVTDRRGGRFGGTAGAIEEYRVRSAGIAGKGVLQRLKGVFELGVGVIEARTLVRRLSPRVVVGFGGYASVPTMLAAGGRVGRSVIHEQNAVLGRANRLLATRVDRIATAFVRLRGVPEAAAAKVVCVGMPVRPAIAAARTEPYPPLSADGPVNVLVLGGSQGARVFGRVVPAAITGLAEAWRRRIRIAQQCRPEDLAAVRDAYAAAGVEAELTTFFDDVPRRLAAAHLLITRAGASTVAEATTVGRPAILVPYPYAADDHQTANALAIEEAGAGWILAEPAFTPDALADRLTALLGSPAVLAAAAECAYQAGQPDAAQRLADVVCGLIDDKEQAA